jgi:hypothetical protein
MEKINYKHKKGVFFTDTEFEKLQEKILAQRQLIEDFEKELEV